MTTHLKRRGFIATAAAAIASLKDRFTSAGETGETVTFGLDDQRVEEWMAANTRAPSNVVCHEFDWFHEVARREHFLRSLTLESRWRQQFGTRICRLTKSNQFCYCDACIAERERLRRRHRAKWARLAEVDSRLLRLWIENRCSMTHNCRDDDGRPVRLRWRLPPGYKLRNCPPLTPEQECWVFRRLLQPEVVAIVRPRFRELIMARLDRLSSTPSA